MKKNVASQVVGAQMLSATDGSEFTGAVTVYVTVDGGTQAIGTVSSGACVHEGHGFHTYVPSQAETNGDHIAYTFVGSGALTATVQVYTDFPQTGDAFARLGAPVGASISADIAGVQSDTDNIQTRLPAALVSGRMDSSIGAVQTGAITAGGFAAGAIDAAAIATDALGALELAAGAAAEVATAVRTELATELGRIDVAVSTRASQTSVDTIDDYVDTEVAAIKTDTAAIKAKTDNLPSDPADASDIATAFGTVTSALSAIDTALGALPSAAENADAVWEEAVADHSGTAGSTAEALAAIKAYADRTVLRGTVAAGGTTTTFTAATLSVAGVDADQFKGRIILFDNDTSTAALRGQGTDITANTSATLPVFTFSALSRAPAAGDSFSIV